MLSCILGRVVKALDLSPSGHSPREFEPRRMHLIFFGVNETHMAGLLSLVVEHSLCKRKVGGSIPPVGLESFCSIQNEKTKRSTSQRFELWRAEPNRFLIYLLNHSDTMSYLMPTPLHHSFVSTTPLETFVVTVGAVVTPCPSG